MFRRCMTTLFGSRKTQPIVRNARRPLGLRVEELTSRIVPSTSTFGVANWGTQVYTPYDNVLVDSNFDLAGAAQGGNFKYVTLGFVNADGAGNPSWDGDFSSEVNNSQTDLNVQAQVDALRSAGGDVQISFGGEDDAGGQSTELARYVAQTMGTGPDAVAQLVSDYQQVIDAYHLTHMDFDIEGGAATDNASIVLRAQALAQLQQNNPGLQVSFTIGGDIPQWPDFPYGMTSDAANVVNAALDAGVKIANVNLMTMDFSNGLNYYDKTAVNEQLYATNGLQYGGDVGPDGTVDAVAIKNAQAEFTQLQQMLTSHGINDTDSQIWSMVGITPEIGRNATSDASWDQSGQDSNEIFSLQDAQNVETFAAQNAIGRISIWSINRDQSSPFEGSPHSETDSSLLQTPEQFSQIFAPFSSSGQNNGTPSAPTGLSASAADATVTLVWNAVAGATSYNVYRGTASGQEQWVANVPNPTFTETGLSDGTTYFYEVTAVNGNLEGQRSAEVSATPSQPAPPAVQGAVVMDVRGQGISRFEAATGWVSLSPQDSPVLASNSEGDVVASLGGHGLWRYEDATGWQKLSRSVVTQVAIDSSGDVVASFKAGGIFRYEDRTGLQRLRGGIFTQVAINDNGDVAAVLNGRTVWRYEDATGWQMLYRGYATQVGIDDNDDVVAEVHGKAIQRYVDGIGWTQLFNSNAAKLAVNGNGDVVAEVPGSGVWLYENDIGSWNQVKTNDAAAVAITQDGDAVAAFAGNGVWYYATENNAWEPLSTLNPVRIGA